ncbi:MAG TPA: tripartite tricarboxylate transporter substrate binding protein [Xanthobacteraceae bacterium]|nr:tripartite tricarboxylate transporter substrate binding protein [Xanthobacteraceae bacterium]
MLKLKLAALAIAAIMLQPGFEASAQDFPKSKPISFICAFPPGSGADIQVRYLADKMSQVVGQTILVENKPGAAGNIAAEYVVRSRPDGFTVYVHSGSATAGNMHLFKNPPFDVRTALQPVASISKAPFVLTVLKDYPANDIRALTEILKKKGAAANYAASATSAKIMGEIYKQRAGLETVDVSYRTGQDALNDMAGGRVEFAPFDAAFAMSQAREGRVRVLAVSAGERTRAMPDVPTMREQGVEMNQLGWWGGFVAAGTPEPIVQQWNGYFKELLSRKDVIDFHTQIGADVFISSPKETHDLLKATVDEWAEFVKIAKIPQN